MPDVSPLCLCTAGAINWQAVEAVGTIAALGIAIAAPIIHTAWLRWSDRRESRQIVLHLITVADEEMHQMLDEVKATPLATKPDRVLSWRTENLRYTLRDVRVGILHDADARAIVVRANSCLAPYEAAMVQACHLDKHLQPEIATLAKWAAEMRKIREEAVRKLG